MRVFVYEYCCAIGLGRNPSDPLHGLYREGRAMRDALAEDMANAGCEVVVLDGEDATTEADDFQAIVEFCDRVVVIAPEFSNLLLERIGWVPAGKLLGPSAAATSLTQDKLALAEYWHTRGVPHPHTRQANDTAVSRFPVVLKPRDGVGSTATFLCRDPAELVANRPLAQAEYAGEFIVQEYHAGQAASSTWIIGEKQRIPLAAGYQRLSSDGRFQYQGGGLPLPAGLHERAIRLADQALQGITGLVGYVGVDLILGDDEGGREDVVIEINPRLTTSYVGLRKMYLENLAELWLKLDRGETVGIPQPAARGVQFTPAGAVEIDFG